MADDKPIPIMQYDRPDGKSIETYIVRPAEIEAKARMIHAGGFRLESKVGLNGLASFTVSDDGGDYATEACANGPDIMAAFDKLVMDFDVATPKKRAKKASVKRRKENTL